MEFDFSSDRQLMDLNFFVLNIQGFTMDKLYDLTQSAFSVYDFVCLTETWIKPSQEINLEVKDYTCINKPRQRLNKRAKTGSGGVLLLYIHNRIMQNIEILDNTDVDDRL